MNDVTCWRYSVPNVDYDGWAVAHLDNRGFLAVIGDYGEFGHLWHNFGDEDFRVFLSRLGPDYLMGKLGERSELNRKDTVHELRREICQDRQAGSLDREQAREDWDAVAAFEVESDATYSAEDLLDELHMEDAGELFVMDYPPRLKGFMERTWPRLVAEMQKDLAREAEEAKRMPEALREPMRHLSPTAKEALNTAVKALYFADSSDYYSALWGVVGTLLHMTPLELENSDIRELADALNPEWHADAVTELGGDLRG